MPRRTGAAVLFALLSAAPVRAQMIDCQPQTPTDYTIFLDDFHLGNAAGATPEAKQRGQQIAGSIQSAVLCTAQHLEFEQIQGDGEGQVPKYHPQCRCGSTGFRAIWSSFRTFF